MVFLRQRGKGDATSHYEAPWLRLAAGIAVSRTILISAYMKMKTEPHLRLRFYSLAERFYHWILPNENIWPALSDLSPDTPFVDRTSPFFP